MTDDIWTPMPLIPWLPGGMTREEFEKQQEEQERLLADEFIADVRRTVKQLEDYKKVSPRKGIWLFATDAIECDDEWGSYYSYGLDVQGIYRFKDRAINLAIKYVKNIDFEYYKQIKEASQSLCQYLYIENYCGTRVVDSFYNWLTNTRVTRTHQ